MVTTPNISYQPAVALQGEPHVDNYTTRQEPKVNTTQPKQAASAGTQSSDETNVRERENDRDRDDRRAEDTPRPTYKEGDRGSQLDMVV